MEFHIVTLFPGMFESPLKWGILGRALERGLVRVSLYDIRAYAPGPHRVTDDYPYGGGEGMVMKPEPLYSSVEAARANGAQGPVILLSPQGALFNQDMAKEFAKLPGMILVCGRYEGVDERVRIGLVDMELSIGDYVLTGGELGAMVVIDAVSRLLEGVLGNEASPVRDSFEDGLLKHPQYTRPRLFRGMEVPEVLLSGNHAQVRRWRRKEALRRTLERRPDLLEKAPLSAEDLILLDEIRHG